MAGPSESVMIRAYEAAAYDQVVALEQMTPDQVQAKASDDLQALTQALQSVQDQGFVEAATFQPRVQQAQQQLAAATTKSDYFAADGYILDQDAAVTQIVPVYHQIQALASRKSGQWFRPKLLANHGRVWHL